MVHKSTQRVRLVGQAVRAFPGPLTLIRAVTMNSAQMHDTPLDTSSSQSLWRLRVILDFFPVAVFAGKYPCRPSMTEKPL